MKTYCAPSKRMEIGRRVFARELTEKEAAAEYGVAEQSIYQCVRECLKSAGIDGVQKAIESYVKCFNEGRLSHALGCLTPKSFREMHAGKPGQPKKPSGIAYEKKAAIAKAKAENEEKERRLKEGRWKACLQNVD